MNLIQYLNNNGDRQVAVIENGIAHRLNGYRTVYEFAQASIFEGGMAALIKAVGTEEELNQWQLLADGQILFPIDHPDPAHLHVTGTGLTHLGSASTRDAMHKADKIENEALTDSMKMFRMGLENGKSTAGSRGVQPEWFYKGNGYSVIAPGAELPSPAFALDSGEEPEIAGIYLIDDTGQPCRLGFSLANEFSDHVTEKANYLYLAHSKLRPCSFGPELRLGPLPMHINGMSRIFREGEVVWEKPFLSGEDNMSHSIENLEYHHFKYGLFRKPGDIHIHMFGTATLSFADGFSAHEGDTFEIAAPQFGMPLRNTLGLETDFNAPVRDIA